ncbi:hypothetical protein [Candidatus Poriferisocius sp.]|uniref:hypothetical protein n=1 Tax=Candidatus Poriferisocius sp. TaxID=3101276 RepID=UPI003B028FA2
MEFPQVLEQATRHVESGLLKNEAQIKQAVIVPVLRALGWNDTDPGEFVPEYQVDNGFVDFALLIHQKPQVFVEAKRLGNLSLKAEEQLFSYAANQGIPLLVLTDGSIWDFYLSMAAGEPASRRFNRIELSAVGGNQPPRLGELFHKFLAKEQVASGSAKRDAETLHEDARRRAQAREALPDVWQHLLNPPNELLIDLLAEEVESVCGVRPRNEDVEGFLCQLSRSPSGQTSSGRRTSRTTTTPSSQQGRSTRQTNSANHSIKIAGYRLHGNEVQCSNAIATLMAIVKDLQSQDLSFLSRLYSDPRNRTRKRVFISKQRSELFQTLHEDYDYKNLGDGWWMGANLNVKAVIQKIELVCDVADLTYGTQLTLVGE